MNILEIIVLIIIAICVYRGYRIGFLRVIYSLVSWILVLAFVTWATPYLTDYLENIPPVWCCSGEVFRLYRKTCRRKNTGTGT